MHIIKDIALSYMDTITPIFKNIMYVKLFELCKYNFVIDDSFFETFEKEIYLHEELFIKYFYDIYQRKVYNVDLVIGAISDTIEILEDDILNMVDEGTSTKELIPTIRETMIHFIKLGLGYL